MSNNNLKVPEWKSRREWNGHGYSIVSVHNSKAEAVAEGNKTKKTMKKSHNVSFRVVKSKYSRRLPHGAKHPRPVGTHGLYVRLLGKR